MLTLEHLQSQINPTIWQRGKQYYRQKAVVWLEETEENNWEAEVEGTETYQVTVTLAGDSEISHHSCDCPYEGEVCKHTVAVLLTLQAKLKKKGSPPRQKKTKKDVMDSILQAITLQELQDFVRRYAATHRDFKTDFELHFADKDERVDVEKKYKDLFRKILSKHSDRGFVDYRASFGLSREMDRQLQHAQELVAKSNFRDALAIAKAALKTMMQAVQYSDDSAGNIGGTLYSIGELFGEIALAERAAVELKEQVYTFLEKELQDQVYFGFGDIGYELFGVYHTLAVQLNKPDSFLHFVDTQIVSLTGPYDDYQREFFQLQKVAFLKAVGREQEAADLVWENLDIVAIRQGEVDKAIAQKDYAAARKLITEGIGVAESKDHPGTVEQWEKQLLRLAVLENDLPAIRRYTRKFALDGWFNSDYYKQWKATYPAAEWKIVIDKYIADTIADITQKWKNQKSPYWKPAHPPLLQKLAPVYIQEQYWDKLLELVQQENRLDTTLDYHTYLAPRYPAELLTLYLSAFEKHGQQANGRSDYARLAHHMQKVMQDIPEGREKIKAVAQSLMAQFPRRPAMLEELRKVL